jgi:RNase P subunit RPR2
LSDESYETPAQREALQAGLGELYEIIKKQLNIKLQGYRAQDTIKKMFVESEFMDMENTVRLLKESDLKCYYCKECVKVLYRQVREGCQWTLERIDNDYGHVKTNVVIACLTCNLRRRTMYHERFAFTKQLVITKNN